ncbi:adenylate/guanylate cyclase domain-containing protein [uncultured Kordia sp.]|uniref:adenylate/guanylate cyclase domain-containing protein n=1 Tax=uncultured Kordia sp. TaxID=507699 RepID=UPI00262EC68B|nr:adenylate/guanylate cyclase domain-containing protein [uncultured Kordia sp.]
MLIAKKTYYKKEEKRKLISLLFFVLISSILSGQVNTDISNQKRIGDSLFLVSKDEIKKGNYEEALSLAEKSLTIFKDLNENESIGNCYKQIATVNYYQGEFYDALTSFENSKEYFTKAGVKNGIASTTNNIGAIYYYLGNYSKALDNYKNALELHDDLNNEAQIAGTTQNIGNIYLILNDFENAKKYYKIAKEIHQKIANKKSLSLVLSSIGSVYMNEENYDTALSNYEASLKLAVESNEKQVQTEVFFNLGKLYEAKNNFSESVKFYNKSLNIAQEIKSSRHESSAFIALGAIQLKLNKKEQSIKNCKLGLEIAEKLNIVSAQEQACKCLYDSYKSLNRVGKALLYNERMYLLKDSLNLKKTTDKLLNMEFEKEMLLDSIANVEKERKAEIAHQKIVDRKEKQRNIFLLLGCFAIIIAGGIFSRLNLVKKSKAILQVEKDRSEHLLLNILPEEIAEELKEKGFVDAQDFETASILFTDFKSFTETASRLTPQQLVEEINVCFKAFDHIMESYKIEKIKTIGDAYMAAGGLPKPDANAVKNTILAAIKMQAFMIKRKRENDIQNKPAFEMRVGIHVGPIVAGIVGVKKFQYDIWGDTVNTASRMESNSMVGKVNISQDTYLLVKNEEDLAFEYRGKITAKGKGELEMYFVSLKA